MNRDSTADRGAGRHDSHAFVLASEPDAPVIVETRDKLWRVTLNRPQQGNAFSPELVDALDAALSAAQAGGAQTLVIRGDGKHFCTGFDLSGLDSETDDSLLARFVRVELLLQRIAAAPLLTVALAHGRVTGAGADLFVACSVRVARHGTRFSFPGASGFGIVLGTGRLARRIGARAALQIVESGRTVPADEALALGLATATAAADASLEAGFDVPRHDEPQLRDALRLAVGDSARDDADTDLGLLVRSAARPGLRDRIAAYRARSLSARASQVPGNGNAADDGSPSVRIGIADE